MLQNTLIHFQIFPKCPGPVVLSRLSLVRRRKENLIVMDVKERHKGLRGASEIMGSWAAGTAGIIDARFPGTHLGPN